MKSAMTETPKYSRAKGDKVAKQPKGHRVRMGELRKTLQLALQDRPQTTSQFQYLLSYLASVDINTISPADLGRHLSESRAENSEICYFIHTLSEILFTRSGPLIVHPINEDDSKYADEVLRCDSPVNNATMQQLTPPAPPPCPENLPGGTTGVMSDGDECAGGEAETVVDQPLEDGEADFSDVVYDQRRRTTTYKGIVHEHLPTSP